MTRVPPSAVLWGAGLGFWFYLDRAGPGGLGGWIAPPGQFEATSIDIEAGAFRVSAPLRRDADGIMGRQLLRFQFALPMPECSCMTFRAAGKSWSILVMARRSGAPIIAPATLRRPRDSHTLARAGRALITFAPIDWTFRRQRSQQLTQALARDYDVVFYLGPASLHLEGAPFRTPEGVLLPLLGAAPGSDFATRRLTDGEAELCAERLSALLGDAALDVLVQFPSWRPVATRLRRARIVYDCIDDHAHLPHVSAPLEQDERGLVREAAFCIATSETLAARLVSLGAEDVLRVPNATQAPKINVWPHRRDAAVVYLGAIESWFDFEVVRAVADALPGVEVRLVGACGVTPPRHLSRRIRFLGEMDHASAMRALIHARVGIIPFQRTPLINAVDPVKAYEYLAAGLPVVMTPMGGGELAQAPGVSIADDPKSFAAAVASAYAHTRPEDRASFARWSAGQTWTARADAMRERLNSQL